MKTLHRAITIEDGTELHWEERGDGEALLLLHGFTGRGDDWAHVFDLDALAAAYRLLIPDARGHGRSTNPTGDFSFRRCALDVIAILDELGIAPVRAIGMSLGAKTLLHLATEAPERVRAMILVSGTPRFPEATRAIFRAAAVQPHSPEEWAAMRARHVHGDAQIASLWRLPARFAEEAGDMSFTSERLRTITAKTLIVAGDRDPLYPVELAVELYRGIAGSSLWVVPNGGHGPIFEAEGEAFARVGLPFLSTS